MSETTINPAVMQHLIEALQHEIDALGAKLPNSFIISRLNRGLADMRAQVGYDLAQVISAPPNPVLTGEAAELAQKVAVAKNGG